RTVRAVRVHGVVAGVEVLARLRGGEHPLAGDAMVPPGDGEEHEPDAGGEERRSARATREPSFTVPPEQDREHGERREHEEVRPRERGETERDARAEAGGERAPEEERERRRGQEDRQARLVDLAGVEYLRLVEREPEGGEP